MHRSIHCCSFFIIAQFAGAQVQTHLLGNVSMEPGIRLQGANVSIDTLVGYGYDPNQIAFFQDSTASIGLDSGIVMTTGVYLCVNGPNNMPNTTFGGGQMGIVDNDLLNMASLHPSAIGDPAVLWLTLVPWGDTLFVNYVFGSEEYDEYVCTDKDDRMGMFLSGPGISGPFSNNSMNIATLPASGLPVTVNTLNRGAAGSNGGLNVCYMDPLWLQDTIYYINNDFGPGTQMDGYSVVLTAKAVVQPGETYQLKIGICDATDGNYDSAIFLPQGGIHCSEISTGIDHPAHPASLDLWCNELERTVNMRGFPNANGPVRVEVFDAAGRLVQCSTVQGTGSTWSVPLDPSLSGMAIVRAVQAERVVTGRVFVR